MCREVCVLLSGSVSKAVNSDCFSLLGNIFEEI